MLCASGSSPLATYHSIALHMHPKQVSLVLQGRTPLYMVAAMLHDPAPYSLVQLLLGYCTAHDINLQDSKVCLQKQKLLANASCCNHVDGECRRHLAIILKEDLHDCSAYGRQVQFSGRFSLTESPESYESNIPALVAAGANMSIRDIKVRYCIHTFVYSVYQP